jgi:serine/threonine-protein kinase
MSDLREQLQSKLGATYAIERELGGGGMSRVFVATEPSLGRRVVVKVLPPDLAHGVSVDRFKREIQLAAQLQHPHIVPLLTAGEVDGLPYFTMPFIEGESLRARLTRGELPVSEAVGILRDVAKALDSAHAKGVVHRDIKPDNVLLSGGSAVVTDFGVAKAIASATSAGDQHDTLTVRGVALGTPMYMAPEQAAADPRTDHRADIYAFGTMAYEMLVGRAPFAGRYPQQLAAAHATEAPVAVTQLRPAVPPSLGVLVMRCLEKSPADRPQTAREILRELDAVTTPIDGNVRMDVRQWYRRSVPLVAAVIVVVAALAAIPLYRTPRRPGLNPKRVVVVPPENLTPDSTLSYVPRIAADHFADAIRELDSVQVVSSMALGVEATRRAKDTTGIRQLANEVGAGTVVRGTFYRQGDSLVFRIEAVEASTGNVTFAVDRVVGPAADPRIAIDAVAERLTGGLAVTSDSRGILLGHAPAYAAYKEVLKGEELFMLQKFKDAIPHFQRAVDIDSSYNQARLMLATSYGNIPDKLAVADSIFRKLDNLRSRLTNWERLAVDFARARLSSDQETAFRLVRTASARNPEWLWLYLTGEMGVNRNYPRLAIKSLRAAHNPSPDSSPVPYWRALATAYHQIDDFKNELDVANHADSLHHGEFLHERLRATAASGDTAAVRRLIDSVATFSTNTDATAGQWMYIAALELRAHQHFRAADTMFARAQVSLDTPAHEQASRSQRRDAAAVLLATGRYDSAYARLADLARDTADLAARGRAGVAAAGMGDTAKAKRISGELAAMQLTYRKGRTAYWRAAIAAQLGDKEQAVRLLKQAIMDGQGVGYEMHRLTEFQSLRGYAPFDEILRPKG